MFRCRIKNQPDAIGEPWSYAKKLLLSSSLEDRLFTGALKNPKTVLQSSATRGKKTKHLSKRFKEPKKVLNSDANQETHKEPSLYNRVKGWYREEPTHCSEEPTV